MFLFKSFSVQQFVQTQSIISIVDRNHHLSLFIHAEQASASIIFQQETETQVGHLNGVINFNYEQECALAGYSVLFFPLSFACVGSLLFKICDQPHRQMVLLNSAHQYHAWWPFEQMLSLVFIDSIEVDKCYYFKVIWPHEKPVV